MRHRRLLTAITATAFMLFMSGCQWMSVGWDATGSADNTVESQISTSTAASLHTVWSATLGPTGWDAFSEPVAFGSFVFAVARLGGSGPEQLDAFDAAGVQSCSGSPVVCAPLWHANGTAIGQPLAVNGVVYVDVDGVLEAFDAAGSQNCTGTPKVCAPLWSGSGPGTHPIYQNNVVYVGGTGEIDAYSTDTSGCIGTPLVCHPVKTYSTAVGCAGQVVGLVADAQRLYASVALAGTIMVMNHPVSTVTQCVAAYDLASTGFVWSQQYFFGLGSPPNTAGLMDVDGHVYASSASASPIGPSPVLAAFDPAGTLSWSTSGHAGPLVGTPTAVFTAGATSGAGVVACDPATGCGTPLRTYDAGPLSGVSGNLGVANGVLFVTGETGSHDDFLLAFDAAGSQGCTGTPTVCEPIASLTLPTASFVPPAAVVITGGRVYTTQLGKLVAYGL